jgi:hypothetical protein
MSTIGTAFFIFIVNFVAMVVKMFKGWCVFLLVSVVLVSVKAQNDLGSTFKTQSYVSFSEADGGFPLFGNGSVAPLIVAANEFPGVHRVAAHLQNDLLLVTGLEPAIITQDFSGLKSAVIIGTLGQSSLIDGMVAAGKLDVSDVAGRWELSLIQVVDEPLEGIDRALVIVGSDKRGTMFGMFDLSAQIGVSPWYWWADVPVEKQSELYVKAGRYNLGEPKVQYRGIFLNDEEPALGNWVREHFEDFNADFYVHVYELLLRMKGNFLWPAMWGKAHADDDINNAILADEYGIVISYTHHEPMMRAHVEWSRYGDGPWDYTKNKEQLDQFWTEGVARNNGYESFITIGMRGDGDEAMSDDRNIDLMTDIILNQRRIIGEVSDKPVEEVPQLWALYKEVQEYYDMGMRVADDIMLLYCDDNWGNVRRMPGDEERARSGGLGMYYHFDYVGGPRNYKWINTNPLPKIWEQNKLTYEHGVNKLWVVNVGDLKPMEFPIQFYLDLAWDPDRFESKDVAKYSVAWARQQFGAPYAEEIAGFMDHYGKINGRRKPEMLDWNTFSLTNYREFERVADEYNALAAKAAIVNEQIPDNYRDAYYQLVLYPIEATANLYNLYHATAKNHMYARQGRSMASHLADSVRYYYEKDSLMTRYFHTEVADGKWNHMMSQTRIGYTYWQQPESNVIPKTESVAVLSGAHPGMLVEGHATVYGPESNRLPEFDAFNQPAYYLELFNKGDEAFKYRLQSKQKWVKFSSAKGLVDDQERIYVSIDWSTAPVGINEALINVKAGRRSMEVKLSAWNPSAAQKSGINGFVETNGYVSMESSNFSKVNETDDIRWLVIPDIGRTLDGVVAQPYMVDEQVAGQGPSIEYELYLRTPGTVKVHAYFSPTLNYPGKEGLHYAMSFNKEVPVVVNAHADESDPVWYQMVGDKIMVHTTEHTIGAAGVHTLKYHMVSPGLVLQKIVVDTGGLKQTYLGPEESYNKVKAFQKF